MTGAATFKSSSQPLKAARKIFLFSTLKNALDTNSSSDVGPSHPITWDAAFPGRRWKSLLKKSWMHKHWPSEVCLGRAPAQGQAPHAIHGEEMPPTGQPGQSCSQNSSPLGPEGIRTSTGVVQLLSSSFTHLNGWTQGSDRSFPA